MHLPQVPAVEVRVDGGRGDGGVPEQLLHDTQVGAPLQQVRGERVPQRVRVHACGEARAAGMPTQDGPPSHARERTAAGVAEHEVMAQRPHEQRSTAVEPFAQGALGVRAERDQTLLVALAGHGEGALAERDAAALEADEFRDAQAAGIGDLEHRAVAQPLGLCVGGRDDLGGDLGAPPGVLHADRRAVDPAVLGARAELDVDPVVLAADDRDLRVAQHAPDDVVAVARLCAEAGVPVVIGTTGWDAEFERALEIVEAGVVFEEHPHPACPSIAPHYGELVGLSVARGFTHQIRELFGGPRGCSHTTALLQAMAPVAVQSMWSFRIVTAREQGIARENFATPEGRQQSIAMNLNTCHVWAEDGEQVRSILAGEPQEVPVWIQRRYAELGRDPMSWRSET